MWLFSYLLSNKSPLGKQGPRNLQGTQSQYFDILHGTTEAKGLGGLLPSISNKLPPLENIDYKGP